MKNADCRLSAPRAETKPNVEPRDLGHSFRACKLLLGGAVRAPVAALLGPSIVLRRELLAQLFSGCT